jgi:pyrroloquinoline quinone biosynthesis protein D
MRHDPARDAEVLLFPEGVLVLNSTAAAILAQCDGSRNVGDIAATLSVQFEGRDVRDDVAALLDRLAARGLVEGNAN